MSVQINDHMKVQLNGHVYVHIMFVLYPIIHTNVLLLKVHINIYRNGHPSVYCFPKSYVSWPTVLNTFAVGWLVGDFEISAFN